MRPKSHLLPRATVVGSLMIDIVDAESNKLVWRGIATDSIPKKSEKVEKKLYNAVDKLFRHFPPENRAQGDTI